MGIGNWIKSFGKRAKYGVVESAATAGPIWMPLGGVTGSGVVVTPETAMRAAAVYSCVRVLAETMGTLPLITYERKGENKERATKHPLTELLRWQPNPGINAVTFIEMMQAHLCLRGNAYAEIVIDPRSGYPMRLVPLNPDRVRVEVTDGGENRYKFYPEQGKEISFSQERIFHVTAMALDGRRGLSPIDQAREVIGASLAMDRHTSSFFKNGAKIGGVLKYPGKLSQRALENFRESWQKQHSDPEKAHETAILEQGMEYTAIGMTHEQAEFVEAFKLKRSEIAGIFRVPPHMIGDLENATFSNIEHQSLNFETFTIRPWAVRWETAIAAQLLSERERETFKVEFLMDALRRGDFLTRQQGLAIQRQNGVINADEWRAIENRNPLPDDAGKEYLMPMNMKPMKAEDEEEEQEKDEEQAPVPGGVPNTPGAQPPKGPDTEKDEEKVRSAAWEVVWNELKKVTRKHATGGAKAKKNGKTEVFVEGLRLEVKERLLPVLRVAFMIEGRDESGLPERVERFAEGFSGVKFGTFTEERERLKKEMEDA